MGTQPLNVNLREIMSRTPVVTDAGLIPDPKGFSVPSPELKNLGGNLNVGITTSGGIIGPRNMPSLVPEQFHAPITAIDKYHNMPSQKRTLSVYIWQGWVTRESTLGTKGPHIDDWDKDYPNIQRPVYNQYIVSDCLPTRFYIQPFYLPESQEEIRMMANDDQREGENFKRGLSRIFESQARDSNIMTVPPCHLAHFSAYTVHEAELPEKPTFRTMMLVRFEP